MGYMCAKCGEMKEKGSRVFIIDLMDGKLPRHTCSKECAEGVKERAIKKLDDAQKIEDVKNISLVEGIWTQH